MKQPTIAMMKTWFPSLRRRQGARFQLFCFPFAGGGASAFRSWQDHLPLWVELWPLEYPGHESRYREPAFNKASDLAAEIAEVIAAAVELPFAFFGHSMGALLAFETARHLRRSGGPNPTHLFVSGYGAPHLPPFRPPIRNLPEAAFRDELRRYGGTPEDVLADDDFMRFLTPLLRRDLAICETYAHESETKLPIPIVAFGGNEDPTVPWHRLLAWSDQTSGDFRAHFVPGGHFFIKTAAPLLCKLITQRLDIGHGEKRLVAPDATEAHLWVIDLADSEPCAEHLRELLDPNELKVADAFVDTPDRDRYTLVRAALRDLLGRYRNLSAKAIQFPEATEGKPSCEALLPLEFNVSHSGTVMLIGVSWGQAIGVDVERVTNGIDVEGIALSRFTPSERRRLASALPKERPAVFLDLWVRKQAYSKRVGTGKSGCPQNIDVGRPMSMEPGPNEPDTRAADGALQSFSLVPGYAAAVASDKPLQLTTVRQWHIKQGLRADATV